jgi:hypothetical protein
MDFEMNAYKYDNATGDWSQLCASPLNASFRKTEGSAMLQVAPSNAAQAQREAEATQTAILQLAASGGGGLAGEGKNANEDDDDDDDDDDDNADSDDAAAMSRRIVRQSEKLLRLLQGASSTQLSGPALAGLTALTDARTSAIEAMQLEPVGSGSSAAVGLALGGDRQDSTFDGGHTEVSW